MCIIVYLKKLKEMAFLLITALVADDAYSFPGTGKVWACE